MYFFHPDAAAEYVSQVAFYDNRRKGLGARYLASFGAAMERVCRDPMRFRIECEPDLRRVFLRGFPFAIIYREFEGSVQVLAGAHQRLRPGYGAAGMRPG